MKAYEQILLTTDFTKLSVEVAKKAVNLAGHFNAQITLLHVINPAPKHFPDGIHTLENLIDTRGVQIKAFVKSVPIRNATSMLRVYQESIESEIISVAKEIKASLIIIGSHHADEAIDDGRLNINIVKEQAMCDVLVVHPDKSITT